jgi:mannose-6-phosphate isomerase
MQLHPLIFEPIVKPKLWGGRSLERLFGKRLPSSEPIGETWELADLPGNVGICACGPARGRALGDLLAEWGSGLTGKAKLADGRFPLLIKFLDAQMDLSVQVHPSPAAAERLAVPIKHEAWYVIHAEPGAGIYLGVKEGVTTGDVANGVKSGTLVEQLRWLGVKAGDCCYLPSGIIHALGAGIVVAEIQTPSDVTYRLYDWDRVDSAGKPRQLHVEQALESMLLEVPAEQCVQPRSHVGGLFTTVTRLVTCDSFLIDKVRLNEGFAKQLDHSELVVWVVLAGQAEITVPGSPSFGFKAGQVVTLPAALRQAQLKVHSDCVWLEVTIPSVGSDV